MHIDLNCDMGESYGRYILGDDIALLDVITSANIACGFHAGDPVVMASTVQQAVKKGVAIGAHPGYPDLQGFGRRAMALSPSDLSAVILYQISALAGFAQVEGTRLTHVKPHGALYNTAIRDKDTAEAIVRAVQSFDPSLVVVTLPGSILYLTAVEQNLRVAAEGFADRAYQADGSLLPRGQSGAVIHDPDLVAKRAVRMVTQQSIRSITGEDIEIRIDTLCVHGDTPGATEIALSVREAMQVVGVTLTPFASW